MKSALIVAAALCLAAPPAKALAAEEATRFALLEEHWDVIVVRY